MTEPDRIRVVIVEDDRIARSNPLRPRGSSKRNYIRNIYEKLQVHTKSEAVSKALRAGLL